MAYLFVHFKEKSTPDGEQVYFSLSKDGFHWDTVNKGEPILYSRKGDEGVRDHTIVRTKEGKFFIISTDLSLSLHFKGKYKNTWDTIRRYGSKYFSLWESDDLVIWSEEKLIKLGDENFGNLWAPDIIYDKEDDSYVLHWSSAHSHNNFGEKGIYYSKTKDFKTFSKPKLLYQKEDSGVIDSAIYEVEDKYYMFVKSEANPARIILLKSDKITGPYEKIDAFDEEMEKLEQGMYEAPTFFRLPNNKYCLMLDYYGVPGEGQGYVPFISDDIKEGKFKRSDDDFSFPYGFKHGTVLEIFDEEYERILEKWGN